MNIDKKIIHDSHISKYRNHFGAIATNSSLIIRIKVDNTLGANKVLLRLWKEDVGESILEMKIESESAEYIIYEIVLKIGEKPGVIWYYFILEMKDKKIFYGNNKENLGGEGMVYDHEPPSFQITIFANGVVTPTWFKNAIIYQVFPDRFYRDDSIKLVDKKNRLIHGSWNNKPNYFKDVTTKEIIAYDFFGGNLKGIIAKLSYLKELGISVIYLNPIFEAQSNHRYDTGDYHKIDSWLGDIDDFTELCEKANKEGIAIFLDGVFSHTGSDSKYFNKEGNYNTVGAYQSKSSPYYDWYCFEDYPEKYQSWWGFKSLPNVNEINPSYQDFIINNDNSVLKYWLKKGIKGWRLDVVDEVPDLFLKNFYKTLKQENSEAVVIGEVWEDASHKVSYGRLREYLNGYELDSAMNYPFRRILIDFVLGYSDAKLAERLLMSLYENYPLENFYAMMNLIGSHDEVRILTILGEAEINELMPETEIADYKLPQEKYSLAIERLKLLAAWQMTFPGVPSIYYGDEVGMQGYKDPHNRGSYIWGKEDKSILSWYKKLTSIRNNNQALRTGTFKILQAEDDVLIYSRVINQGLDVFGKQADDGIFIVAFNRSKTEQYEIKIDVPEISEGIMEDVLTSCQYDISFGEVKLNIDPLSVVVLKDVTPQYPKKSGILLHPTSLPSIYGHGNLGEGAYSFIDFLEKSGQTLWQILPLNIPDYFGSPYQSASAFAGNINLLDIEQLEQDGLLTKKEIEKFKLKFPFGDSKKILEYREEYLQLAFSRFKNDEKYNVFCQNEIVWLNDYALFMALSKYFSYISWNNWPEAIKKRSKVSIEQYNDELLNEVNYYKFTQYLFNKQWGKIKKYANSKGIKIIGDLPIFVAHNSADVWANQKLFNLDEKGQPKTIAGVPPDYFSGYGQLWGNPHYNWEELAKTEYKWWLDRFQVLFNSVDVIRVDHFRGFEAYWEVPFGEKTAVKGRWIKAPGKELFQKIIDKFVDLKIIAEDLGNITPEVIALKQHFNLPGMNILQFSLLPNHEDEINFLCDYNSVVYTGTHDNNTMIGWFKDDLGVAGKEIIKEHLTSKVRPCKSEDLLIEFAYSTRARVVMIPLQDFLALDSNARMNLPGSVENNWLWQCKKDDLSNELAEKIKEKVLYYKRNPKNM